MAVKFKTMQFKVIELYLNTGNNAKQISEILNYDLYRVLKFIESYKQHNAIIRSSVINNDGHILQRIKADNKIFDSKKQARIYLGITKNCLNGRLRSENYPTYEYLEK